MGPKATRLNPQLNRETERSACAEWSRGMGWVKATSPQEWPG